MKTTILKITYVLIILSFTSCGSNEKTNSEKEIPTSESVANFIKSYEGTINGKYEIIMTLTRGNNSLSGTYSYKNKGIPIKISGNIDDHGNLSINEFNAKGSITGVFKGQLSGTNIIGNWEKPDGSKIMPFSISESANAETSIAIKQTKSDDKQEILSNLIGEHKLNAISYFAGANTIGDYWIENGKWTASESINHGGQREGYNIELKADVLQKLKSMKIVVSQDLSVSLTCNGKIHFTSQYKDNGMDLQLIKSPKDYSSLPETLKNSSTIIENKLYIFAKDNINDDLMSSVNIVGVSANALVITFDLNNKQFEVYMFEECCDNASYVFK